MNQQAIKTGKHKRIPWGAADPKTITVHARFDKLKGTFRANSKDHARGEEKYLKAKRENDHSAAAELVEALIDARIVDALVDAIIAANRPAKIVFPYPEFDAGEGGEGLGPVTNALPFQMAAYLAIQLGAEVETNIVECARPGRTKLTRFPRFLWQPRFSGNVDTNCVYILVDDNCTLGGTFAMLRSHIAENGGTVIAVTALTTPNGLDCQFGIADNTRDVLIVQYGEALSPLWIEEIGHDISCLTDGEGTFLATWEGRVDGDAHASLQRLRDRLGKAKSQGK